MTTPPRISIVIPVFNEAAILETALRALHQRLTRCGWTFEIIIAQNGSTDDTVAIATRLGEALSNVRLHNTPQPNYGRALREGIRAARHEYVVCDEIDLGDLEFYERAIERLDSGVHLVVGSKRHPESVDARPWSRRLGTAAINGLLALALNFPGTDTHGLKAFHRETMLSLVESCRVEHHLFASELVIRAHHAGLRIEEIPLRLREIRPPSMGLLRRMPTVARDLLRLVHVIRFRG